MSQKRQTSNSVNPERAKRVAELAANYEKMRAKDATPVRGKFVFHESPGGTLSFTFGPMYKGDEQYQYTLTDGQIYTLPLAVAKHLNKNLNVPEYNYVAGSSDLVGGDNPNAQGSMKITRRYHRTSFQSLEFMDIEDLNTASSIVTVEHA